MLPSYWNTLLAWLKIPRMHPACQANRDTPKLHLTIKPLEHEQLLKLSCVTTWSFRSGSVRHGGLNWGLVSLPIKRHKTNISVKNQLHPPPNVPLCSHFDICVKQGLRQILPLQAQSSYLGKSQLSGCVIVCMHVSYISMISLLPYQHARVHVCMCMLAASNMLWCTSSWG